MDHLLLSHVHKCTFCSRHLTKILIEVVFYEKAYLNFSTICQIRSVLTFTFSPLCPYASPFFSLLSFLKNLCRCFKSQEPFSNEILINIAMVKSKPNNTWCKYNESVCCQRTRAKMDINYHRQWVIFPPTNQNYTLHALLRFPLRITMRAYLVDHRHSTIHFLHKGLGFICMTAGTHCTSMYALHCMCHKSVFACVWSLIVKGRVFLHGSCTVRVVKFAASSTS